MTALDVAAFGCAYLLGSIPVAWILVRLARRQDLSRSGSTNVGALNAMRVARSPWVGVAVLVLDAAKGAAAVGCAQLLGAEPGAGLIGVVAGHCFNAWLSLRLRRLAGGKGFAASAGGVLLLYPWLLLAWLAVLAAAWVGFRVARGIRDEAPASAVATLAVVPAAAWGYGAHAGIVMGLAALMILSRLGPEVLGLLAAGASVRRAAGTRGHPPASPP